MLFVALPFYVYRLTGQAMATGATFFALTLPRVLLGSVGGVFADRANRQRLITLANLASAVALLPLLFVHSANVIWLVYVVAFLSYSLDQFAAPAERAILPGLVGRDRLVQANALFTISNSIVNLLGPPLGGLLLGVAGFSAVVLIDIASFVLAAALIALMRTSNPSVIYAEKFTRMVSVQFHAAWHDWLDGLRLIRQQRGIQLVFTVTAIAMVEEGIFNSLWAVWVSGALKATSFQFGLLGSALGAGILMGGIAFGRLGNRLNIHIVGISAIMLGVILAATINFPILWLTVALTTIRGTPVVGFFDGVTTLIQQKVQDAYVGRILGFFSNVKAVMLLVGTTLAILFTDKVGVIVMLNAASIFWIIAGLTALVLSKKMD